MSTVIQDPRLQELFNDALHDAYRYEQAFILALNERLQAAEKMAEAIEKIDHARAQSEGSSQCRICNAIYEVEAYRRLTQEQGK